MLWENKRLRDVVEFDLRQVIDSGLEEHNQLEYKQELYTDNEAGKKEFLLDICQFANAEGGLLLIGVPEKRLGGKPTGIPDPQIRLGIENVNPEQLLLAYDARLISGIDERLSFESAAIPISDGRCVIAYRIPNSVAKPHCVQREGRFYFPMRRHRNRYPMDVREIKESVMRTASRLEKAEHLLTNAFTELNVQVPRVQLVIGTIPIFWQEFLIDLRDEALHKAMATPAFASSFEYGNAKFSFGGLQRSGRNNNSLVEFRRTGLIRASQSLPSADQQYGMITMQPHLVDVHLRNCLKNCRSLYEIAGVSGPFLLGMRLIAKAHFVGLLPDPIHKEYSFPSAKIPPDDYEFPFLHASDFGDVDSLIRPLCDQAHQMFGELKSDYFDSQGKWIGPE